MVYQAGATGGGGASTSEYLYSLERLQPYRGGHMVASLPAAATPTQMSVYGYSEQVTYDVPTSGFMPANGLPGTNDYAGVFQGAAAPTPIKPSVTANVAPFITQPIGHTIGGPNDPPGRTTVGDDRDMLVFNDRDFTSVAELMLVPGCPPGLFTKQFVEAPPPLVAASSAASGSLTGNLSLSWINTYGTQPPGPTVSPNGYTYSSGKPGTTAAALTSTPWPANPATGGGGGTGGTGGGGGGGTGTGGVASLTPPVFGPSNPGESAPRLARAAPSS